MTSATIEPSAEEATLARVGKLWRNFLNAHSLDASKVVWLDVFLHEFNQLNEEWRLQFEKSNTAESLPSALSQQLLLCIHEICDPPPRTLPGEVDSGSDRSSGLSTGQVDVDIDERCENRYQALRQFFLRGIGGRIVVTLDKIGVKALVNNREIANVLVHILPTNKWESNCCCELDCSLKHSEQIRSVFKMRTFDSGWRNGIRPNSLNISASSTFQCFNPARQRSLVHRSSASDVTIVYQTPPGSQIAECQTESFRNYVSGSFSQDQFTFIILNLLENLVVHENILTIDENSATVASLRMALDRLKKQELLEESPRNRLVIRHKLLGILMLCLNNLFFLESFDFGSIDLRLVASEVMELLKLETETQPNNMFSCDFLYNLTYTIVSTVNQSFLSFCVNQVSEQLFLAVFKLLESNLDIIKHVYNLLNASAPETQTSGLLETILKMMQNFILALSPSRSSLKIRKARLSRLHHSRQEPRSHYVCALENLLLNLFPLLKHSDQKHLVNFFKEYQLCCCNTNIHTLEMLLKLSNEELVPKLRLSFVSRHVIGGIFNRSQCVTCECDRHANSFFEQFSRTHRDVFREYAKADNRARLPIFLKYLQDMVKCLPFPLSSFVLQQLVMPQLRKELDSCCPGLMDETGKEVLNGLLSIVCSRLEDKNLMNLFYSDENIELIRMLNGRVEFSHHIETILKAGILHMGKLSETIEEQLRNVLLDSLDDLSEYLGHMFDTIGTSEAMIRLRPIPAKAINKPESIGTVLQTYVDQWKVVCSLLRNSNRFREFFQRRYANPESLFLSLAYNIVSLTLYRSDTDREHPWTYQEVVHLRVPAQWVHPRISVLNIFNFNDALLEDPIGSYASDEFYYSAEYRVSDEYHDSDSEYSFLWELNVKTVLKEEPVKTKLQKSWSIGEVFNIHRILTDIVKDYLPKAKQKLSLSELPVHARQLLECNAFVRKKLYAILELVYSSMQSLCESNKVLEDAMQVALLEVKRLLLTNANGNWDCPDTARNVMNALQCLLKVAEVKGDPGGRRSLSEEDDHYYFPDQSSEYESVSPTKIDDDVSSTDGSYATANDDGYEGDVEIDANQSLARECSLRFRTPGFGRVYPHICSTVVEILIELSKRCTHNPEHWCPALAQMIVKLNVIRGYLGGSLYLIDGFQSVLETDDPRLKQLQTSILELIVDLNNPVVFAKFIQLLALENPPVQLILTKLMNIAESDPKLECYQSLNYPIVSGKHVRASTCDLLLYKKINYVREHHFFGKIQSCYTEAAKIAPLNYVNFYPWHVTGFTAAVWLSLEPLQMDNSRFAFTHVLSVGSEKQTVSLYLNPQRQLVLKFAKPDKAITVGHTKLYFAATTGTSCCDDCAKEMSHLWTYKHLLRTVEKSTPSFQSDASEMQCVYCYKLLPAMAKSQTAKLVSRVSDYDTHTRQFTLKDFHLPEGRWMQVALAAQQLDDVVQLTVTLDGGLQQQMVTFQDACKIHIDTDLAVLCVGHRIDGVPDGTIVQYAIGSVHLFKKCITDVAVLANLYSIGPNWTNFGGFREGKLLPNYGTLNLAKLALEDLRVNESLTLLHQMHLGFLSAHKPDTFITGKSCLGVVTFSVAQTVKENLSLQRSILLSGGISVLLFAFARVVELSNCSIVQSNALRLLLRVAHENHDFYNEFLQCNLLELLGIVLKNKKCQRDASMLVPLLEVAFDQPIVAKRGDAYAVLRTSNAKLRHPEIIIFVLENFSIWIDRSEEILDILFTVLTTATREKHPGMVYNCKRLETASLVPTLIDFCRVNFVIPTKSVKISKQAANALVSLIAILSDTPPRVSLLKEIMELLLLMHKPTDSYVTHDRQKFYFNINASLLPPKSKGGNHDSKNVQKGHLRDRRMLRYSQLRKAIPPVVPSDINMSLELTATTSFMYSEKIGPSQSTDSTSIEMVSSSKATILHERNYERLNEALADARIRRKSLKNGKHKLRRLNSPATSVCSTPKERSTSTSPKYCTRNVVDRSGQSLPPKFKFFTEQNYFGTGNDFIQESFLRALCDFLLILPDQEARQLFAGENQILETLLILANNGNIKIRTMIINLVAVVNDRVQGNVGSAYTEEQYRVFWYHLGNQIGAHSANVDLLTSCFRWITKTNNPTLLEMLAQGGHVQIIHENGLHVLMAVLTQSHSDMRLFQLVLQLIDHICDKHPKSGQYMVDNGLVWAIVKTAVKMHEKENHVKGECVELLLDFATKFSHRALKSNGIINPFWDLVNGLTAVERHKNATVTNAIREMHALLYKNVLQLFLYQPTESIIGHRNNSFNVELTGSTLSKSEVKARFNQIHDKAVQFITNTDPEHTVSEAEFSLIKVIMNRTLNGNPRGGNIILWCLLPKRPVTLKIYTIRQLGQYVDSGSYLSLVCDLKMLKVFAQSILLLNQKHIPLEDLRFVNAFCQSIEGAHSSTWNLTQTLEDFEYLRSISLNDQQQMILKSINRNEKLIYSCTIAAMEITRNIVEKQNRLRKELIIQLRKDSDFHFFNQWRRLIRQLTHEGAPWYNPKLYPESWELDDTYGPLMVQNRMRRCDMTIDRKFLLKELQLQDTSSKPLLSYLIPSNSCHDYSVEEQVLYTFTARTITVKDEVEVDCIITSTELVLKRHNDGLDIYDLNNIARIWPKRYQHLETAVEIFLRNGKSLFIVFDRPLDRETFEGFFHDLVQRYGRADLEYQTQLWRDGQLMNWEYLMLLNQISGRTYHDLMQYPVLPWILADYDSPRLDLLQERSYRCFEKPIAVQHRQMEKHYINNYNYLKQTENDPIGRRKIKPYHYSSHYSNSGTVLHFLVRTLPFTSLFLQYQDDSFDIPDRTFHSLNTTWNLASKDSPTDVKELIPEFFTFPEFLENLEGFDFGLRQSGDPVNHVELPSWAQASARLFVLIHRQALESDIVRRQLSHWIDLIFGYKQSGQPSIDAINVFHPATYCDFSSTDIDDPVERLAMETMVKTYGQMPRQLFDAPHPAGVVNPLVGNPPQVMDNVHGLKWGLYCGSPVLPTPRLTDCWNLTPKTDTQSAFSRLAHLEGDRICVLPERTNVFRGLSMKRLHSVSWGGADGLIKIGSLQDNEGSTNELIYNTNVDPITACGTDPSSYDVYFGHRSGRIAVFQQRRAKRVSFFNQHMQPSVTRTRSSSFRRWIDRKSATLRKKLEQEDDGEEEEILRWKYPVILVKHKTEVTAIEISADFMIVVSVSMDGTAVIWDSNSLTYVREIPQPVNGIHSKVSLVAISPTLGDIVTVHSSVDSDPQANRSTDSSTIVDDESIEVTENYNLGYVNVAMASDRDQLRLHTINAKYVEHVFVENPVLAVCYSAVKEGSGVNCIAVGLDNGIIRFYTSWNLALIREININSYEAYGIQSILFSKHHHLLTLTTNNVIQTWKPEGLTGPAPFIVELPPR